MKEIEIQEMILKKLENLELYPYQVTCTFELVEGGLVSITLLNKGDIEKLLEKLDLKSVCDNTGILKLDDSGTIIFTGMALVNLYSKLDRYE